MHKVILILDKFFLKYEGGGGGGVKLTPPSPQEKLASKSPALLGLRFYKDGQANLSYKLSRMINHNFSSLL